MKNGYEKAIKVLKSKIKDTNIIKQCENFAEKFSNAAKKIVKTGDINIDLAKIIGLLQGLQIFKKNGSKKKRIIYSLTIASLIVIATSLAVKVYEEVKGEEALKKKIKLFVKSLNIESAMNNPIVKKIKDEVKEVFE